MLAVTHQYHLKTMHESENKGQFVTFAGECILLGYMATKPARKIEQVMAMILGRIMVKNNCEHLFCTSQDKVQQIMKAAENVFHVRLLQSKDLYQQ